MMPKNTKKETAKKFRTKWCAAIASNDGDSFEEEWGLQKGSEAEEEKLGDVVEGESDSESSDQGETAVADLISRGTAMADD